MSEIIPSDLRYVADLLDAAPSCRESVMNVTVDARGIIINAAGGEQAARHWAHTFGGSIAPVQYAEFERPPRRVAIRGIDVDSVSIHVIDDPQPSTVEVEQ